MDEEMEELYKEFAEYIIRLSNFKEILEVLAASNEKSNNLAPSKRILPHEEE